ncbi:MAG TPA: NAD-dependent succinate-semialdehyde dehydrogenase [Anaerolineae bacterium]|nr:NAD-dependent succinate-semialdehyde dehydrogenase [Anaerolineae bacterium]
MQLGDSKLLRTKAYINGEWVDGPDGATFPVTNPATGEVIANVAHVGVEETRHAIDLANVAFKSWRKQTGKARAKILRKWADLMMDNQRDLATIMTAEQGKPLAEAMGEIAYAASFVEWFGEEAKRVYGDTIPGHQPDKRIIVLKEPIGVCAGITPWNFPSAMITRKGAPAIAAGCTIIFKPAAQTPLSALALCELAERAGLPPGVFNVITCPSETTPAVGEELTTNPIIRKVGFTGSTSTGKRLMAQSASTVKKVSLELGGNAPFIVFDDADLDAAVEGAMASKYRNAGQTCVCANRIYVQDGVYDAFSAKLVAATQQLKVGNGFDEGVTIGPLIDEPALEKVERLVADALDKGASLALGGKPHPLGGTFYEPTVLTQVTKGMEIQDEEIFGPVSTLFRFKTDEEAIELANNTPYGLASYFYSRDISRVWRVAEGLEYGMIGINTGMISTEVAPFGGVKESGIGREGSKYGIDEWIEIKYLCLGGIE